MSVHARPPANPAAAAGAQAVPDGQPGPPVAEAPLSIELPRGSTVLARCYGERTPWALGQPLVLHFHGGTFACGGLDNGRNVARLLAAAGARVVSVAYPLAPRHPFPEPIEAGYATLEWLHRNRTRLAGRDARLFLAGESAGANLAAGLALVARDRHAPPVAGQLLLSPMLDPCVGTASLRSQACATTDHCKWADGWQQYLGQPRDALHPYAVPGASLRLASLPRALILVGPDDPLRDEAMNYARRLRDAGVDVHSHVVPSASQWPDALYEPDAQACERCKACVLQHFDDFLHLPNPPPRSLEPAPAAGPPVASARS